MPIRTGSASDAGWERSGSWTPMIRMTITIAAGMAASRKTLRNVKPGSNSSPAATSGPATAPA